MEEAGDGALLLREAAGKREAEGGGPAAEKGGREGKKKRGCSYGRD